MPTPTMPKLLESWLRKTTRIREKQFTNMSVNMESVEILMGIVTTQSFKDHAEK